MGSVLAYRRLTSCIVPENVTGLIRFDLIISPETYRNSMTVRILGIILHETG